MAHTACQTDKNCMMIQDTPAPLYCTHWKQAPGKFTPLLLGFVCGSGIEPKHVQAHRMTEKHALLQRSSVHVMPRLASISYEPLSEGRSFWTLNSLVQFLAQPQPPLGSGELRPGTEKRVISMKPAERPAWILEDGNT